MAHKDFIDFLARIKQDSALQARVQDLGGEDDAARMKALIDVAAQAGFRFTDAEVDQLFEALARMNSGELGEAELAAVAGGIETVAGGETLLVPTTLVQAFSLQYMMVQQGMQLENRQFTMISNILKTKHDTAKSSISNIR